MPRYMTFDDTGAAERAVQAKGLEPIVVDDKLVALEIGDLRIYAERATQLRVSQRLEAQK